MKNDIERRLQIAACNIVASATDLPEMKLKEYYQNIKRFKNNNGN